jgi:radical SAM protein with 4Fe4S-binding SPASM domain
MLDIKLKLRPGHTSERAWMSPSSLTKLFWNVTYACNYRCGVCFTDSSQAHPDELTREEALATVKKAKAAGVRDIIISGGEAFLREDILDILSSMAEEGITSRIASNGSLLSRDLLLRLKRETLTQSFQISLDTVDPLQYAELHGVPVEYYEKVRRNLRDIQEVGFHTTVSVRLTPETLPGIPRLLDLAVQEDWATLTIHLPVQINRAGNTFSRDEDIISHLEPVFDHFVNLPRRWIVETYIPWAAYHPVIKRLEKKMTVVHRGCRAGRNRLTIQPRGHLSPCVCMDIPEAYMGNVRQDELLDIFQNSRIGEMFRKPQAFGICRDCQLVASCGGGCRASAFALTGNIQGQDRLCPIWRKTSAKK